MAALLVALLVCTSSVPARAAEPVAPTPTPSAKLTLDPLALPWPLLALGGAAVLTATSSIVTAVRARDVQAVLDGNCLPDRSCAYPDFREDKQRGERLVVATRVLAIGSATLAASAVALWFVDRRRERRFGFGLFATPSSAHAQLSASF